MAECRRCEGRGWYVVPVCCQRRADYGGCCGQPDPGQEQCANCNGTGIDPASTKLAVPCEVCGGEGRYITMSGNNIDSERDHGPCAECDGTGSMLIDAEPVTMEDLEAIPQPESV